MASTSSANPSEQTPLLSPPALSSPDTSKRATRNVTFNPNPSVITIGTNGSGSGSGSGFAQSPKASLPSSTGPSPTSGISSSLNSKLRRRNSYGSPLVPMHPSIPASKIGPQRTTKNVQKLKLLPNPDFGEDGPDEESGRDVYSQYTRIKDPTARRDAARLGKADRDRLPRVTAYCTANKYQLENVMRFLKGRGKTKGANPKLFDECIYTPFRYGKDFGKATSARAMEVHSAPVTMRDRRHSDSAIEVEDNNKQRREDLIDLHTDGGDIAISNGDHSPANQRLPEVIERQMENETEALISESNPDFDTQIHTPEVFLFDYGVVVIWGMSVAHEQRFLKEIARFESEKLAADDVEMESFNFYYTKEYQARIYNDFITLREKGNYMTKLAISHALAQSVKTSLFESLVDNTIETCKDIPTQIALTGTIALSRKEINMQIGELFILRINIHLNGSVLDTPELFWVEPQLEPIYQAVRSYLEMDQRVKLLSERLDVIADLLAVLKDQLSHRHGEKLEWVVIVLIAVEILVAVLNIVVDLSVGE
ncbi:sporulation protein RMD1 [Sclerotinia borealis F-4128]|uniref:Sporulation protein RMD1 n=1 Tax=Sclerotinia borealis (strain F-4128) TaxID=1432307 RepID=W9C2W0_SCLBF|nr:sporulation protein RMD1 [Sclerotinia borealis F-4128]